VQDSLKSCGISYQTL